MSATNNIDNSDGGELERCISWQFEHANGIVGFIDILKDFFKASTEDFWNNWNSGIIDIENVGEFPLSVLGNIIGVERTSLLYEGEGETEATNHLMSVDLYRKLIVCRARLLNTNASVPEYIRCLSIVFGNSLKVIDNLDMSMSFVLSDEEEDAELRALYEQRPDLVFVYPAGVDDGRAANGNIFALARDDGQARESGYGGLDDSTFEWRR